MTVVIENINVHDGKCPVIERGTTHHTRGFPTFTTRSKRKPDTYGNGV